jgi:hypothetical protein
MQRGAPSKSLPLFEPVKRAVGAWNICRDKLGIDPRQDRGADNMKRSAEELAPRHFAGCLVHLAGGSPVETTARLAARECRKIVAPVGPQPNAVMIAEE